MNATAPPPSSGRERQLLCGLLVESELDLHQQRPAPASGIPDVRVHVGARVPADARLPEGTVTALVEGPSSPVYTFVKRGEGSHLLRFHGACDFEVGADLRDVVVRRAVDASPGIETVLAAGAMLATQLYLRGALVLHASAVDIGGRALAFVGRSGMGKSTVAALMCGAGARLITDDVLRIDHPATRPRARLGASEVRLRKGADSLVAGFVAPPARRTSADRRHVLRLPEGAEDNLPLTAVVIPRPDRHQHRTRVEALSGKQALLSLLSFPRIPGWRDQAIAREQFHATAALLDHVPVLVAHIPWGPPFPAELASELATELAPYASSGTGPTEPTP